MHNYFYKFFEFRIIVLLKNYIQTIVFLKDKNMWKL